MEAQIKDALKEGPKTTAELVTITGKSESTVRKATKALVESGALTKNGTKFEITPTSSVTDDGAKRGRGRPKDPFVAARDERVFAELKAAGKGGATVATVAEALDVKASVVYISVWRLRQDKRVTKVLNGTRQPAWAAA